ncbi:hypothetical protein, partial [Sinorhizobium fredii]|uniref:hypothetical protein n=1 Tax=Rhizobium fredii TaxID=380 RepID=UPI0012FD37E0
MSFKSASVRLGERRQPSGRAMGDPVCVKSVVDMYGDVQRRIALPFFEGNQSPARFADTGAKQRQEWIGDCRICGRLHVNRRIGRKGDVSQKQRQA